MSGCIFEGPSAPETEQERSSRHSRNAYRAMLFTVFFVPMMVAFSALMMWLFNGYVDVEMLGVAGILSATGLALGFFLELRKYK